MSWTVFFQIKEIFIQQKRPSFLAWMSKVAWLSNLAFKAIITSRGVNITS